MHIKFRFALHKWAAITACSMVDPLWMGPTILNRPGSQWGLIKLHRFVAGLAFCSRVRAYLTHDVTSSPSAHAQAHVWLWRGRASWLCVVWNGEGGRDGTSGQGPPCLAGVPSLSKVQAGGEEDGEVEKTKNRCLFSMCAVGTLLFPRCGKINRIHSFISRYYTMLALSTIFRGICCQWTKPLCLWRCNMHLLSLGFVWVCFFFSI